GSTANTACPSPTSMRLKFISMASGGDGSSPLTILRRNSRPDNPRPASPSGRGSCQLTVRVRFESLSVMSLECEVAKWRCTKSHVNPDNHVNLVKPRFGHRQRNLQDLQDYT